MNKRKLSYTESGMLLGLLIGSGLASVLFIITGEATYFGIAGVGLALGLGLGAAFDGAQRSEREQDAARPPATDPDA